MTQPQALSLATLVTLLALLATPSPAAGGYDPSRIGWTELHYKASKLGFSIESRLRLRRMSPAELSRRLIDPGAGEWLSAPETGGWLLGLETTGLGRRSRLELLLDPEGGSLQRTQIETGRRRKDHRNRTHRFSRSAIHIGTRKPTRSELDAPASSWSDRSEWRLEIPPEISGRAPLGQATGIFYALAAAALSEPGDRATTHVLSKGRIMEVELVVEAHEGVELDFVEVEAGGRGERSRNGRLETLRVRVSGRELGGDAEGTALRFLGLRGDVRVHLDTATRAPVQITGRAGWLGEARVKLRRLVLGRH